MTELLVVIACIALNAALAAVEAAFMSVSKADLRAEGAGNAGVRRLLLLRDHPERTLSVIQVGVTLVAIVSAAVGGAGAREFVAPFLEDVFHLGAGAATTAAIAIVAVVLMFVTVLFGELVPKAFALRHPDLIAIAAGRWLLLLEQMLLPVVALLSWATRRFVAIIPRGRLVTRAAVVAGNGEHHYALNLVDLAQRRVKDAVVPWTSVTRADAAMSSQTVADLALRCGHTRLPVEREGRVVGLLHTKELLNFIAAGEAEWQPLVRPIVTVGLDDRLLGVLRLLQRRRSHLALVTSRDGAPIGVVTVEDILEEVLGDLYDEDDDQAVIQLLAARGKVRGAELLPRNTR
jgi:putative hemolysin